MSKIKKIPIIRVIYRISNAYCYKGDTLFVKGPASRQAWLSRIGKGIVFSLIFSCLVGFLNLFFGSGEYDPREMVIGSFPSILGFGIGVFALLFTLPKEFSENLKGYGLTNQEKMLPADMAYPLVVYATAILFCAVLTVFENIFWVYLFSGLFLYYGMLVTFDLLSSIFSTAMVIFDSKESEK